MATKLKLALTDKGAVFEVGTKDIKEIAACTALLIKNLSDALEECNMKDSDGDTLTAGCFMGIIFIDIAATLLKEGYAGENDLQKLVHNAADYIAQKYGSGTHEQG